MTTSWVALGDRAIRFARPAVPARAIVRAIRAGPVSSTWSSRATTSPRTSIAQPALDTVRLAAASPRSRPTTSTDAAARSTLRVVYDGPDSRTSRARPSSLAADVGRLHAAATTSSTRWGSRRASRTSPASTRGSLAAAPRDAARARARRRARDRPDAHRGLSVRVAGGWHLIGAVVEPAHVRRARRAAPARRSRAVRAGGHT